MFIGHEPSSSLVLWTLKNLIPGNIIPSITIYSVRVTSSSFWICTSTKRTVVSSGRKQSFVVTDWQFIFGTFVYYGLITTYVHFAFVDRQYREDYIAVVRFLLKSRSMNVYEEFFDQDQSRRLALTIPNFITCYVVWYQFTHYNVCESANKIV